ncbi:hypothetical protein ASPWEDRAFT_35120 [Aspergillus wentii DTO 134E9]|uniref:Uncharacterized protein n=1 Tax=Aspergillus wentii DTO 134E9 TaxID=1073089 RepID=A0A1L9S313_ASPWE|nr:uncharacterized protein ASPWEDRAFT_35120 [Aspergillus wentii DTO 134E9]OJJ41552.1 hypothetical protein ASPWEDRAFT_35120 [Aspergillus wentii DTO 134E9]
MPFTARNARHSFYSDWLLANTVLFFRHTKYTWAWLVTLLVFELTPATICPIVVSLKGATSFELLISGHSY